MTVARRTAAQISNPTSDGKRYFLLNYDCLAFNDVVVEVTDGATNPVFLSAQSVVYFEGIALEFVSVAAGINTTALQLRANVAYNTIAGPILTTTATQTFVYHPQLGVDKSWLLTVNPAYAYWLAAGNLSGYGAADNAYLVVWGWIDSPSLPEVIQSVSLEGYKWPLTKRRV